jgi:hypothetical protein
MVVHRLLYFLLFFFFSSFFLADSTYRTPSLYSLMCAIGSLLSIVPHAGEILLKMLAIDSYWELDTVQLLKHICISGQDLVNFIRPMPI